MAAIEPSIFRCAVSAAHFLIYAAKSGKEKFYEKIQWISIVFLVFVFFILITRSCGKSETSQNDRTTHSYGAAETTTAKTTAAEEPVGVAIDEQNFPDENFRDYVSQNFDNNSNQFLSDKEILAATKIDVSGKGITSMKGLEYFTELTELYCQINNLTELDVSNCTKLITLSCSDNGLTALDVSKCTELTLLSCYGNNLTELNVSSLEKLELLYCYKNNLTELDVSKCTELTELDCSENNLTELDVSKCTELTYLGCFNNSLSEIDLSNCSEDIEVDCDDDTAVIR